MAILILPPRQSTQSPAPGDDEHTASDVTISNPQGGGNGLKVQMLRPSSRVEGSGSCLLFWRS